MYISLYEMVLSITVLISVVNGVVLFFSYYFIIVAVNRGGVFATLDPKANMPFTGIPFWPYPEIVPKLKRRSRHLTAFDKCDQTLLARYGYTDIQSLRSEDAITAAVFAPLIYASDLIRMSFMRGLFRRLNILVDPNVVRIRLWVRIPHPEKLECFGPEIDILFKGYDFETYVEAKWLAHEDQRQGLNRNQGQVHLRQLAFRNQKSSLKKKLVVLGLSLDGILCHPTDEKTESGIIYTKNMTWDEICSIKEHPNFFENIDYYHWKRHYSK